MRAPEFWDSTSASSRVLSTLLAPLGWGYGASIAWKAKHAQPFRPRAKVICVGNLTAGGTGKTPVVARIVSALRAKGKRAFVLTRGYGGHIATAVQVDPARHTAADVGDEALLLARNAPVIVSRDRRAGAVLADQLGADAIVMDDGYQNFALAKDLSLVVVDAEGGFGNGAVLPAGPLREPIEQGLSRTDAVVLIGNGSPDLKGFKGAVLRARIAPRPATELSGRRVVAFAGIGRPEKFFQSLRDAGAEVVQTHRFADHHPYSAAELTRLAGIARTLDASLITTEKDYARLSPMERKEILTLPVEVQFADEAALTGLLDSLWANA
ncbi:MAG TPA: tetraacyldisaccharide 4'-kinase [Rhizomicrobium sp.]|jgi:tetraacyldisaccharide 4'-kinase